MMPASESIIVVEGLTAAYGEEVVLEGVSFEVRRAQVFCIAGGSGCGKSTLLRHMIGLETPVEGRVLIDGDDVVTAQGAARERILRKIGVTFQSGALFGSLDLLENVRLPLEEFTELPRDASDLIATMKLSLVGLDGYAHHLPAEVSGGMRKRAAIARAMALDPDILFLDEPSAGLDPITSGELDDLILQLAGGLGITFVIVSHELRSIFRVADTVALLSKEAKTIVASGTPAELRSHPEDEDVRRFFHPEARLTHAGAPFGATEHGDHT
jgi:phospholipid/cholesterol/gamma-HCH transport system ATP-binding protein